MRSRTSRVLISSSVASLEICVLLFFIILVFAEARTGAVRNGAAVRLILEQIGYGILGGVIAGAAVVLVAGARGLIDASWLQVPVAAAALAFGVADPRDGSGFIAAVALVDPDAWRALWTTDRVELTIAAVTAGGVIAIGVLEALVFAVGLSIIDVARRSARPPQRGGLMGRRTRPLRGRLVASLRPSS